MRPALFISATLLVASAAAWCQTPEGGPRSDPQPIYKVTVVSRTLPAVNYGHLDGPTAIDFRGTVLLPKAKGVATVESKRGRIAIDAKFEHLEPPTRFGREYLTYVLWAITPEGRPKNLGEILVNGSDKAKIDVTTDLQALGLMITAEPYYAVSMPSDVVVLENVLRPDTTGTVEPVRVKYELLPRGEYTMTVNAGRLRSFEGAGESLPYDRYEALLEIYQAQNAIQIAQSVGADRLAPDSFNKAQALFAEAQDMHLRKQDPHMIVARAREAAQCAEDARVIAAKRAEDERISRDREQREQEGRAHAQAQAQAEADAANQAQAEAAAAQATAERERAEADRAAPQAEQARYQASAPSAAPPVIEGRPVPVVPPQPTGSQRRARAELLERLNRVMVTRDTPRGLVLTVADGCFDTGSGALRRAYSERVSLVASMLSSRQDLQIAVEGFTDNRGNDAEQRAVSQRRAQEVRAALVANGLPPGAIEAVGLGATRPIVSNATATGREQNRRVEIVISGPSIGGMALWDRTYPLNASR